MKKEKYEFNFVSNIMLLLIIIFGFLWYSQLTFAGSGLIDTAKQSFSNLNMLFNSEIRSPTILSALLPTSLRGSSILTTDAELGEYLNKTILEKKVKENNVYYSKEQTEEYKIKSINDKFIQPKIKATNLLNIFRTIIKEMIKVFIIIGLISILISKKSSFEPSYLLMGIICTCVVFFIIILPYVSIRYNFERVYLQTLIILIPILIIGSVKFFSFIKKDNIKLLIIALIFIVFFSFYSGFNQQIFGGYPTYHLNNFGKEYELLNTERPEVKSIKWISTERDASNLIYADKMSFRKIMAFGMIINGIRMEVIPQIIEKNSYVYSSKVNKATNKGFQAYNDKLLTYNFPTNFLNKNKNKIYNNGGSEIYK